MRYPYERFLRFLVSRKVSVDKTIGRFGLPSVGAMWEAECRTDIRRSAPHSVAQYIDSDESELVAKGGFLEWAEAEGIRDLWEIQSEFDGGGAGPALDAAIQVFVNRHARARVGLLLLSSAGMPEIMEFVQLRFDPSFSKESLALYTKIFWDCSLLGREGWRDFIGDLETEEEKHYLSLGLSSPTLEDAKRFLQETAGFSAEQILSRIMAKAHSQFEAAMEQVDPEGYGAIKWADLAIKAITALGTNKKAFGGDEAGELTPSEFQNMFSVTVEKMQHVTLSELQGEVAPKTDVPDTGEKKSEDGDA